MKKLIILFLIISQFSCSFLNSGDKPEISVVNVSFSEISVFETTANFTVRLQNSNPFEMNFEGARHNIYLNDIYVGKGLIDADFTIPKLATITQEVKIHLSNISLAKNIQKLLESSHFDYRIETSLYKSGSFGLTDIKITETGSFNSKY